MLGNLGNYRNNENNENNENNGNNGNIKNIPKLPLPIGLIRLIGPIIFFKPNRFYKVFPLFS